MVCFIPRPKEPQLLKVEDFPLVGTQSKIPKPPNSDFSHLPDNPFLDMVSFLSGDPPPPGDGRKE